MLYTYSHDQSYLRITSPKYLSSSLKSTNNPSKRAENQQNWKDEKLRLEQQREKLLAQLIQGQDNEQSIRQLHNRSDAVLKHLQLAFILSEEYPDKGWDGEHNRLVADHLASIVCLHDLLQKNARLVDENTTVTSRYPLSETFYRDLKVPNQWWDVLIAREAFTMGDPSMRMMVETFAHILNLPLPSTDTDGWKYYDRFYDLCPHEYRHSIRSLSAASTQPIATLVESEKLSTIEPKYDMDRQLHLAVVWLQEKSVLTDEISTIWAQIFQNEENIKTYTAEILKLTKEIEDMEQAKLCQEFRGYENLKLLKETISVKLYMQELREKNYSLSDEIDDLIDACSGSFLIPLEWPSSDTDSDEVEEKKRQKEEMKMKEEDEKIRVE